MNPALTDHFKTAMPHLLTGVIFAVLGYGIAGWIGLAASASVYSVAIVIFLSAERKILRQHRAEYISEPQAPGLYELAGEIARRAEVPTPALCMMPESTPQMFVTAVSAERGTVVLSTGLLETFSREELVAVLAHAISQIRGGGAVSMTIAARLAAGLVSIATKGMAIEKRDGIPSNASLWVLIAPLAAALIRLAAHSSRQFRADEASVHLIGDEHPLSTALRKIEAREGFAPLKSVSPATAHLFICSPLPEERWMRLFRTHPPIAERLARLEELGRRPVSRSAWLGVRHANK